MAKPKQRELVYEFDDDDGYDYGTEYHLAKQQLTEAVANSLRAFVDLMAQGGWEKVRDVQRLNPRVARHFTGGVYEAMFKKRFAPIQEWLDENAYVKAPPNGKFFGTRTYRLKKCCASTGFTIQFGEVRDAIHFRMRWGGQS